MISEARPTPSTPPTAIGSRRRISRPPIERRRDHREGLRPTQIASSSFADSLRSCLRLADERSPHFPSAALRCHAQLLDSCPELRVTDGRTALATLSGLRGTSRYEAAETLREICARGEQHEAAGVLDTWIAGPPSSARSGAATSAHALIGLELEELG